ncbi:hypothetical protein [Streptomyces sp. NBC_00892]|uniref:DUF7224 domain-containing protein n=1 Tax=Streptomyces sp. NBC_00892 TaxID=2975861 RepID=UPI00225AEFFE|nr:hypothetical protein [Streptomyces sp. NBC_00892]MCX4902606.1 hypothetical protein [Streptomyces sp. NBC_00892]
MRIKTMMFGSSAKWSAPVAIALSIFYYYGSGVSREAFGYAPTLVSSALGTMYAAAYAFASALAVWESARLRKAGVWTMAPVRSRYRVTWNGIVPVLISAWIMLVLPVTIALGSAGALPTPASLGPLAMAMLLCVAHATIGFGIGLVAPPVIAAPLMAVIVWVLVAFSWSTDAFWMRHVSGQYPTTLMFGEAATYRSLLPHLLLTGGIAAAVVLLWLPLRYWLVRGALAAAVAVMCPVLAVQAVRGWEANPPLLAGQAPMDCAGGTPKVCVPQASPADVAAVSKEATSVLADLHDAGFTGTPELIVDRLGDGRYPPPSTANTWRVGITSGTRDGELRYRITQAAVQFPCLRVDPVHGNEVMLWAATVTGEESTYNAHMKQRGRTFAGEKQVRRTVRRILASEPSEQGKWYRQSLSAGCRQSS